MSLPEVVIVGAGPAGLMAASVLKDHASVTVVDQKKQPGRKFLVAGDGGLNITHSEDREAFLSRYDTDYIRNCVREFSADDLQNWLDAIGIETEIGSSGKVFPYERFRPIDVLNALIDAASGPHTRWKLNAKLAGFSELTIQLVSHDRTEEIPFDFLILALGGGSWAVTGSDGKWLELFRGKKLPVKEFQSSNAGIELSNFNWCKHFEGQILKNIVVRTEKQQTAGDLTITSYGLEGKPAYAANPAVREQKSVLIDFKPQLTTAEVAAKLSGVPVRKGFQSLKLPDSVYQLVRASVDKEIFVSANKLAFLLKNFPLDYSGLRPVEEAISTVGGVALSEIDPTGELKHLPNVFCAGEMLNWDAPTGGYLLQGCFASGRKAAMEIVRRITDRSAED